MPILDRNAGTQTTKTAQGTVGNDRLTPRQEEILLHCVAKGYYEIPRLRTLRELAGDIGISAPSLSLILRRAEGKLVKSFARQRSEALLRPLPSFVLA